MLQHIGDWILKGLGFLFISEPREPETYVTQWRLDLTLNRQFRLVIQKSDGSTSELITDNPEYVRMFADDQGVPSPWVVDEELLSLGAQEIGGVFFHPDQIRI